MTCPICNNQIKAHHKVVSVCDPTYYRDYDTKKLKFTIIHEKCYHILTKKSVSKGFNQTSAYALKELLEAAGSKIDQKTINLFVSKNADISDPVALFRLFLSSS